MRILVTGGSGFIGSSFVCAASGAGHKLAILSRAPRTVTAKSVWLKGNLASPPWEGIEAFDPEVCVHAAWIVTPGICIESPLNEVYLRDSTRFLLELAQRGTRQIVGLGTCVEYRSSPSPLIEDKSEVAPTTEYARCKNALRLALKNGLDSADTSFAWARLFYVYGSGEPSSKLCTSLIQGFKARRPVSLKTSTSVKDYIHVEDVSSGLLRIVESHFRGVVNIGTGTGVSVAHIGQSVAKLMRCPELLRVEYPLKADPFDSMVADATRLRSLGWQPTIPIDIGLQRMVETFPLLDGPATA